MTGLELGETKAVFYSGYNDQLIKSSTVTIQVSESVLYILMIIDILQFGLDQVQYGSVILA